MPGKIEFHPVLATVFPVQLAGKDVHLTSDSECTRELSVAEMVKTICNERHSHSISVHRNLGECLYSGSYKGTFIHRMEITAANSAGVGHTTAAVRIPADPPPAPFLPAVVYHAGTGHYELR